MRDGGRILLAALNLYVRIEINMATSDTNHSVTDNTQTISLYTNSLGQHVSVVTRPPSGPQRAEIRNV